jgi:hypothetical protein
MVVMSRIVAYVSCGANARMSVLYAHWQVAGGIWSGSQGNHWGLSQSRSYVTGTIQAL